MTCQTEHENYYTQIIKKKINGHALKKDLEDYT